MYKKDVFERFEQNLINTTGVPYEIIPIDNSKGSMGLCEVYNKGVEKAQFEILCFAHEDILIHTHQWGQKVVDIFHEHKKIGLIGVAGSSYKPAMPSGWSFPYANASTTYMNLIETIVGPTTVTQHVYCNPGNMKLPKVVCIDGLWFCTRRKIVQKIKFDETTFRRFYCYDVDFSLAVHQEYDVAVTFDIMIEHFSAGSFNGEWIRETLKLHKKWKKNLPVNLAELDERTQKNQELGAFYFMLQKFISFGVPVQRLLYFVWSWKILSITGIKTFIRMNEKVIRDRVTAMLKT